MKLYNSFIALERIQQTHKDIAVPMSAKKAEIPIMGKVIAVDSQIQGINRGETLIFLEYATHVVDIKGREYIFVKQEDVIAKIPE